MGPVHVSGERQETMGVPDHTPQCLRGAAVQDQAGTRPARPHTGVTEDGRRLREVLTYTRRGSRLSAQESAAWARRAQAWWIPEQVADETPFDLARWFGRDAPLVVEIGS